MVVHDSNFELKLHSGTKVEIFIDDGSVCKKFETIFGQSMKTKMSIVSLELNHQDVCPMPCNELENMNLASKPREDRRNFIKNDSLSWVLFHEQEKRFETKLKRVLKSITTTLTNLLNAQHEAIMNSY